ncbi:CGCGG family rSAM-modified RiPP protein [Microaerobacter geothermalis]|uniref:CGCGG family putative rSAM-modified RiPP protein n=1 Tax=Microaerobacter geothermalis TaxID=674972 RepID=UPI001F46BEB5|nr:CGCGG family rSAM-modified RiPP protein [Microaerobacter geothermalis]MCF6093053.1 CGCGG family rSAM-modified RiPP protein [Microaerobacter geothermalis]
MKTPGQSRLEQLLDEYGHPIPISWSVPLESSEYDDNIGLVIHDSIKAIEATAIKREVYVNLVTPACHGEPGQYLIPALEEYFHDSIEYRFISQCGCGGYVLRVWRK